MVELQNPTLETGLLTYQILNGNLVTTQLQRGLSSDLCTEYSITQDSLTPLLFDLVFWFAAMVVTNPPEEVRRALASSHNTIALLLLLLLHFMVTHIMGLACVVLGSVAIVGLDRRLRSHADAQVWLCSCKPLGTLCTQ